MSHFGRSLVLFLIACGPYASAQLNPDWTTALSPFQIADHLYYVGSRDLASYLVTTPAGNILINANLPESPPAIRASVEQLGFRWTDTKILLNGQAHFDHMGGAAEVLRETHARDLVMDGDVDAVQSGGRKDFAFGTEGLLPYAPARVDQVLHDGEKVTLGGTTLIAHKTAGHTRGCTTWTMRVHVPGDPPGKLRDVVIVGGLAALDAYRLIDAPGHPSSYPRIASDFAGTFATLRGLPCDVFLGAHGVYFGMLRKLSRMPQEGARVWIDPQGYRAEIDTMEQALSKRMLAERASLTGR